MGLSLRYPAVAGQFYPSAPAELRRAVQFYLGDGPAAQLDGQLKGLIVPHAGYDYSGPVAGRAFSLLTELDSQAVQRVILLGPSHFASFERASISLDTAWITPLGEAQVDPMARELLSETIIDYPSAHVMEHALEVEVPFLQLTLADFTMLPIVCGDVQAVQLATELAPLIEGDTLVIASSDLSHYLPYDAACAVDRRTCKLIAALDADGLARDGEACGRVAILTLLHLARELGWQAKLLDYRNSGDTSGITSRVVGYAAFAFAST